MASESADYGKHLSQLCISFVGGLCAGRTGLVLTKNDYHRSSDNCDIILEGETLSRRHTTITQ
jgi:hypothetical protein